MVEVLIHRGAEQIGGTCVEIRAIGESLLLDLGAPLDLPPDADPMAAAPGGLLEALESCNCKPLALLISHAHQGHYNS